MRPTQYREDSLYLATQDDSYTSSDPRLRGFSFDADAWINIQPSGTFTHRATRTGYDGFAWDGCSPKFNVGPLMFGSWDGAFSQDLKMPEAVRAAKFHDALYQDLDRLKQLGFKRRHADLLFREMLVASGFPYPEVYYRAVRAFGAVDLRLFVVRSAGE